MLTKFLLENVKGRDHFGDKAAVVMMPPDYTFNLILTQ
jgi:hypothetical protein